MNDSAVTIKPKAYVLSDSQVERMDDDRWLEKGVKHFEERLLEKTKQAMAHVPTPLSPEMTRELDRLEKHWK